MGDQEIRGLVRGIYDIQKLRIQAGNRIVNHFLVKLGVQPGEKKDSVKEIWGSLREEHKRLTDGIPSRLYFTKNPGLISSYAEAALVSEYFALLTEEERQSKYLKRILREEPIWTAFLKGVKGVGPLMGGVLVSEIDIHKAKYVSSLWAYAGLDVVHVQDETGNLKGVGRSRKKESLVEKTYIDKNGEIKTKKSITYNPFLKTKLMGVLAGSFLKSKSPYADIYYDTRTRLDSHPKYKEASKLHKHNYSQRKMVKAFLRDLYLAWRPLEGLPVHAPYAEAKLGIVHQGQNGSVNQSR